MLLARLLKPSLAVLVVVLLVACADAPTPGSATPAIQPVVSTPFPAFAAATPPAALYDRPGGTSGAVLPRGTDLIVEATLLGVDGQLWYQVATRDGARGWLAAGALSLVDDPPAVTPTPLPPLASPTPPRPTPPPTPRPLVVAGSGQGLFLRAQPGQGEIIRAYPDGTVVTPLGEETRLDGRRWLRVRTPDGREGWMATDYLRPAP